MFLRSKPKMTRYFVVKGNVQGVMFRQTLIRGAQKRKLEAGATNLSTGEVSFVLEGDESQIEDIISYLKSGKKINSWDARIDEVNEIEEGIPFDNHTVTTQNVDTFNWSEDIEMYL